MFAITFFCVSSAQHSSQTSTNPNLNSPAELAQRHVRGWGMNIIGAMQLNMRNVGIELRWESSTNKRRAKISGRGQTPTRSDIPLPPPFRHPPVRCPLAPKDRSRAHIRPGLPLCGPPLSVVYHLESRIATTFYREYHFLPNYE